MYLFYLLSGEEAFEENVTYSYILHYEETVLRLHNHCIHAVANFPYFFLISHLSFSHSAEQAISWEHKLHLYNKKRYYFWHLLMVEIVSWPACLSLNIKIQVCI